RISDQEIYSDLIQLGTADIILSVEPMEALRYLPYLSKNGKIITSTEPVNNISNYPDINKLMDEIKNIKSVIFVDSVNIARELGNAKVSNTVLVGVASHFLEIDKVYYEWGIETLFQKKSKELIDLNIKAFNKGYELYN
ncbi:MAG: 2-oxoacid:acceptor oxidoreductase family protein, partial [Bacteroidales bacterium]|nr:2-oxoacid:acceptor oxidoreductase family protein [Bacteroidales bacterium]